LNFEKPFFVFHPKDTKGKLQNFEPNPFLVIAGSRNCQIPQFQWKLPKHFWIELCVGVIFDALLLVT